MSKFDKLKERLLSKPKDLSYEELKTLLKGLGYIESNKGKTSGSRVAFIDPGIRHILRIHKPHPGNILKTYVIAYIIEELKNQNKL